MKKILLVEDDASTAELIKALLLPSGYEVIHVENGSGAVRMAKEQSPNLILLDVMLPGLDGYSIQAELLTDEETKGIPIILMTIKTQLEPIFADASNVAGFLSKPFNITELQAKIKSVLETKTKD